MKNKTIYTLLGIGAVYLIYKYMKNKKAPAPVTTSPGFPSDMPPIRANPTPETTTITTMESTLMPVYNNPDQDHVVFPTDAATYQTTYGIIRGADSRKVPLTC